MNVNAVIVIRKWASMRTPCHACQTQIACEIVFISYSNVKVIDAESDHAVRTTQKRKKNTPNECVCVSSERETSNIGWADSWNGVLTVDSALSFSILWRFEASMASSIQWIGVDYENCKWFLSLSLPLCHCFVCFVHRVATSWIRMYSTQFTIPNLHRNISHTKSDPKRGNQNRTFRLAHRFTSHIHIGAMFLILSWPFFRSFSCTHNSMIVCLFGRCFACDTNWRYKQMPCDGASERRAMWACTTCGSRSKIVHHTESDSCCSTDDCII